MFLSRIWVFLLGVFAAAVTALLLLQPRPMQSELDAQLDARLSGADRGSALLLKMHARKWIDAAAQVASDAPLYEALDQASRGGGNLELVHKSAQARLRYFNQDWKTDLVMATDAKGRVVARAGLDENVWKDDVSGWPLVQEALRGYRLDDTWDLDGRLYRVCATPVIARERYVGTLIVGQELSSDLATRIHDTMGVDVAFVVDGKVVAQSSALPILSDLPKILADHAAEIADKGHMDPVPAKGGDRSYLVSAAPLAGEAAAHDAAYVLVSERPLATTVGSTMSAITGADLASKSVLVALGVLVVGVALAFLLLWLEHDRPSKKLLAELQEMARVEGDRLYDEHHRGRFAQIARHVNALLDRLRNRGGAATDGQSMDRILGPRPRSLDVAPEAPVQLPPTPSFPSPPPVFQPPPPPFSSGPPAFQPPAPLLPPIVPLEPPRNDPKPLYTPMQGIPVAQPDLPTPATIPSAPLGPGPVIAIDRQEAPTRELHAVKPPALDDEEHSKSTTAPRMAADAFDAPPTVEVQNAAALGGLPDDEATTVKPTDPSLLARLKAQPVQVVSSANTAVTQQSPMDPAEAALEEEYRAVYRDFLDTKRSCGEPTDGVTYDKFVVKLRQNREQLIQRYACRSVKFQVYIKDGKAALKATPVSK